MVYLILSILLSVLYFFIGLVISGYMHRNSYGDVDTSRMLVVIFWPLIVLGVGLYYGVIGSIRLGEYIGEKIDKRK